MQNETNLHQTESRSNYKPGPAGAYKFVSSRGLGWVEFG